MKFNNQTDNIAQKTCFKRTYWRLCGFHLESPFILQEQSPLIVTLSKEYNNMNGINTIIIKKTAIGDVSSFNCQVLTVAKESKTQINGSSMVKCASVVRATEISVSGAH